MQATTVAPLSQEAALREIIHYATWQANYERIKKDNEDAAQAWEMIVTMAGRALAPEQEA